MKNVESMPVYEPTQSHHTQVGKCYYEYNGSCIRRIYARSYSPDIRVFVWEMTARMLRIL